MRITESEQERQTLAQRVTELENALRLEHQRAELAQESARRAWSLAMWGGGPARQRAMTSRGANSRRAPAGSAGTLRPLLRDGLGTAEHVEGRTTVKAVRQELKAPAEELLILRARLAVCARGGTRRDVGTSRRSPRVARPRLAPAGT